MEIYELVYAGKDIENKLRQKYPKAKITDASDDIHEERFEFEMEGTEEDKMQFFLFMAKEGCLSLCLSLEIMMLGGKKMMSEEQKKFSEELSKRLGEIREKKEIG